MSYAEVGATAGVLPPGYHHLRRTAVIGSGARRSPLPRMPWPPGRSMRGRVFHVTASAATAGLGGVLVLGLGLGAIRISAPCRIVYVSDEPDRRGFACGTLPGHPERGEEAFIISRHRNATVTFTITAFSRPASPLAKGAPAGRAMQHRITSRYLRATPS